MTVIRVEHLSKQYRLGLIGGGTLRADLARWWAMKRGKEDPLSKIGESEEKARLGERFWALRDVSFEVKQGEVLGIIGRNGAGKSTLLKILSRVTSPTEGVVKVKGRIGSLLEVGTGFHGELTGRENTYLNGAILGMTRREVTRKLDEIVAFAEMDKFIDTPVKRYSSGMYVRLAFAVAAHLDPEILIVDEVLAVGDAAFQKKCLGKMSDVAGEGRTVLFVSHNMNAVRALCGVGMLLDSGHMTCYGDVLGIVDRYVGGQGRSMGSVDTRNHPGRTGSSVPCIVRVETLDQAGAVVATTPLGGTIRVRLALELQRPCSSPAVGLGVATLSGERVFTVHTRHAGVRLPPLLGSSLIECELPGIRLLPGGYTVKVAFGDGGQDWDTIEDAIQFEVVADQWSGAAPQRGTTQQGLIWQDCRWSASRNDGLARPRSSA